MFEQYPKQRTVLPAAFARIHDQHYKFSRRGGSRVMALSLWMEGWLHRQVARDARGDRAQSTLEIGAGTLNQLAFEPVAGPYDIVEPYTDLYRDSPDLTRIRTVFKDIRDVPSQATYDRITSIATFEHICDLPDVVARAGLLLLPSGVLRVSIPSEGTPLWRLAWRLTTGIAFRLRYGLDYGTFLAHEHVNTARDIEEVLTWFFRDVRCRVLGLSRGWSVYQFFECRAPDLERCRQQAS